MHPSTGPDLIIGAKGSSLKLTLNTLYHVSSPVENLPYSVYKDFIEFKDETGKKVAGKHASLVRIAIPYLLGDSYCRGGWQYRTIRLATQSSGDRISAERYRLGPISSKAAAT